MFRPENSDEIQGLKAQIEDYNRHVSFLDDLPGFTDCFIRNGLCVSKAFVREKYSEEIADRVFGLGRYPFNTDLLIVDNYLVDCTSVINYSVSINGNTIIFPVGESAEAYPSELEANRIIWNWTDNGHDFCYYLWEILGCPYRRNEDDTDEVDVDAEDNKVVYDFDAYDQFREDFTEPQLVRIYQMLEDLRYIETYTVFPENEDPRWKLFGKSDGSIDFALVDTSFLKNRFIMEKVNLLLWAKPETLEECPFVLTNAENQQYLSSSPGLFGGHRKLNIYGKLDCPSAARHLRQGQYVRNRVFFSDEEIAIAAGYRPCARCMPDAYKKWKDRIIKGEKSK